MASVDQKSQVSTFFRQYLDQTTLDTSTNKVVTYRSIVEEILSPVESWIMAVQSLLVWEKPYRSAVLFAVINLIFWMVSSLTNHILAVVSWSALLIYLIYLWKTKIWPTIRVPSPLNDDEWVPVEANLLSVPELSGYMAEFLVSCQLHCNALINIRQKRRTAFFVLMVAICSTLFVIGHYISGFTLSYIIVMSILIWPCAVYHQVLPRVYMVLEPYLMTLQYNLMSRLKTRTTRGRRDDGNGGVVETDSEDDMTPAINPELSAAIARSITDSEDEGASHSATEYNRDTDPFNGADVVVPHFDEPEDDFSLDPDVSQMPDFENVCEDSNTFMLDTPVMPGMDEIDLSRMAVHPTAPSLDDTDSDTESLPLDLPTHTSTVPTEVRANVLIPETVEVTQSSPTLPSAPPTDSWSTMASSFMTGLMQSEQGGDDELKLDPRDRIADASLVEGDSDSDFEFVLKEDIDEASQL